MLHALVLASAALASASAVSFTARVDSVPTPLNQPLLDCVGSGHGSLALRADYRAHLAAVQRDIGFAHIRGHGLLDDDMSTYLGGKANLFNLFSVFDAYLAVSPPIRPIFELSFMPSALALDKTKTIMHYEGITSTYRDAAAWSAFISLIFVRLEARYGVDEVRTWRVEVWNEPQGCGFFCPAPGTSNIDGYFELYNVTATAINAVDPLISVGGPATAGLAWVSDFVERTGAGKLMPAHFLSTHSYPTDYKGAAVTRTVWEDNIIAAAATAEAAGLPLVMTEVSAGLNTQYDPPFAAAFVIHAATAFLGVANVPTLSYWTLSDIFEEPGMVSSPYVNTYGIQTKYGVPKPSYRAFELLSKFPKTGIFVSADANGTPRRSGVGAASNCTATVGTVDIMTAIDTTLGTTISLHALVTNWNANVNDAADPSTGLPIATASGVVITFAGLPAGAVLPPTASITLLDSTHGWARPVWVAAGMPEYPSAAEIEAEMEASTLVPVSFPLVSAGGNTCSVTFPDLEPYAVARLTIEFAVPPGGAGH
jgi:xylan 1,4-beta-xylosidase